MFQKLKGAANWRALFHTKTTYLVIVIAALIGMIIFQQVQIANLQQEIDDDHDTSTPNSVYGRLYILEGISNEHGERWDDQQKLNRQWQEELANDDWRLKQLEWKHPDLPVTTPTWQEPAQTPFDSNPGHVPDLPRGAGYTK